MVEWPAGFWVGLTDHCVLEAVLQAAAGCMLWGLTLPILSVQKACVHSLGLVGRIFK